MVTAAHQCDLSGAGVLVTRAAHQAEPLCNLITRMGGVPVCFPAVAIGGPESPERLEEQLAACSEWALLIFVSPNAVEWGLKLFPQRLPQGAAVAAVGARTAELLQQSGIEVAIVPPGRSDSEALLAMAALQQVSAKRVAIVRGNGGRSLLGDTLKARGAEVEYVEVYRRSQPQSDATALVAAWPQQVSLVTVTSNDLLDNLFSLLGTAGATLLQSTPMVVVSERMQRHAQALGCKQLLLAGGADLGSLQQAICEWRDKYDGSPE